MTNRDDQDTRYWLTDKGWAATATPPTNTETQLAPHDPFPTNPPPTTTGEPA